MVENTGNSYRTRNAVTACVTIIALAVAVLLYGVCHMSLLATLGVFLIIIGIAFSVTALTYSPLPDKFGPGERDFRLIIALVDILVGIVAILSAYDVSAYVFVAVLLIGIAVIGLIATTIGHKTSKY